MCAALPLGAALEWHTDYAHVCGASQKENKPILLFFNGSDWEGSAMKLKAETLGSLGFKERIGDKLLFMEADFPKHSNPDQKIAAQNEELKKRFKVSEFPALFLLDSQERIIAQISYLPENGEKFAADLLKMLEQDVELTASLKNLPSASTQQLKKIYQLAQELGNEVAADQILEAGLKKGDAFFCLEEYRMLVEKGERKSEIALRLRQKLLMRPDCEQVNGQLIPYTLALIDFQELVSRNCKPEIAAEPLLEYLTSFGDRDPTNVWRIEMMIAEIFLDADKWEEAFVHAEKALKSAPQDMHAEIAHSLDYIRLNVR